MTPDLRRELRDADVFHEVELRLEAVGDEVGLRRIRRMSQPEVDILVRLERGWGPPIHRIPRPTPTCDFPQVVPRIPPIFPQGCPSSAPQGRRGPVGRMANPHDVISRAS